MTCPKCGADLPANSRFCVNCGNSVTDPGHATVQVATGEEDELLQQLRKDLGNDYEIERLLGRGGMAVVYKAVERELQRPVAIKVLPPGTGGQMAERFKREARMAAQLGHPNIIPVYRVGTAANTHFFAMKFVEGRALDAIIESQGPLPIPVILSVLRGAVAGLAHAHEKNIIHRDIKGANVLIEPDGHVLLSDLGIARATDDKGLTATGSVIGTPHFMSPEQCSGAKVGPQSDQYAMGVLAFQMLTGSVPYDSETLMGILQHHFFTPVPDVTAVRPGVPAQLLAVVNRALEKKPEQRFATTREMLRAVEAVPFTEADRQEAEEALRALAVGNPVPKVRTGSLPPLREGRPSQIAVSTAATVVAKPSPVGRTVASPARKKGSKAPVIIGALVVLAAAGGGGFVVMNQRAARQAAADSARAAQAEQTRLQAARDSAARADSIARSQAPPPVATAEPTSKRPSTSSTRRPPARQTTPPPTTAPPVTEAPASGARGLLRVSASPPSATIAVDGRVLGTGSLFDEELRVGTHTLRVSAPGHQTVERRFTIREGETQNLGRITLEPTP